MENQNVPLSNPLGKEVSSIGDLISNAFDLYKKGFKKFIGMIIISFAGFTPFAFILGLYLFLNQTLKNSGQLIINLNIIMGILALVAIIVAIYVALSAQIGAFLIIKEISSPRKVKDIFMDARKYFWNYIVVAIIQFIFVFLWALLFIIPGIIFAVYYSFSFFVLIFEGKGGASALRRSKELVKGYWWAVIGRTVAIGLIGLGVFIIIAIPLFFMKEGTGQYQAYNLFVNVIQSIIGPFFLIYQYLVYKDLVGIKGQSIK